MVGSSPLASATEMKRGGRASRAPLAGFPSASVRRALAEGAPPDSSLKPSFARALTAP